MYDQIIIYIHTFAYIYLRIPIVIKFWFPITLIILLITFQLFYNNSYIPFLPLKNNQTISKNNLLMRCNVTTTLKYSHHSPNLNYNLSTTTIATIETNNNN